MRGMRWQWSGALALGAWLGCGSSEFLCQTDAACTQAGAQGVCQSNGFCSFPDDTCESGQRYGEHAGSTLAGSCVDPEALTAGSEDGPEPTGTATTNDTVSVDGTTLGVDESGPTTEPTTGPSTDDGTTGSVDIGCWFDGFDDESIDPDWCQIPAPGLELSEHDDMLWVDLDPTQWDGRNGQVGEIASCAPRPLLGFTATAHVEQVPQASPFSEAFLEVGNEGFRLGVGAIDGQLYVFLNEDGVYSDTAWQPYDFVEHHSWRIRGTPEGLVADVSPDDVTWTHLHTYEVDLSGDEGYVWLGVWSDTVPLEADVAAFDSLEICSVGK